MAIECHVIIQRDVARATREDRSSHLRSLRILPDDTRHHSTRSPSAPPAYYNLRDLVHSSKSSSIKSRIVVV